ncbi:uncharacterized protein PAC_16156 [Phialocephala subalpina]|uniref:Clr5 domain-containing protein n=1 Tax=Phialocephala subalpina TaxID=576137 RepID=A0A1L7XMI4_9HELO|nr:uncharacterized protein PAC_16156 [Phialocephala subalpina]
MSGDARKHPKFPWDFEVPNDPFWNSLEYTVARNFLQCYTESEISKMHFDETLSAPEKLSYLRRYLDSSFFRKEKEAAPTPFHDANYQLWMQFKLATSTMEYFLENYSEQEEIVREMYENGPDGSKNMSALHQLSGIMEKTRKYKEAEEMALEVLPWMQNHELLGRDAPQTLSCVRILASSVWKQKRYREGGEWMDRYGMLVGGMKDGKFGKYQEAEMKAYIEAKRGLWEWRRGQGDVGESE